MPGTLFSVFSANPHSANQYFQFNAAREVWRQIKLLSLRRMHSRNWTVAKIETLQECKQKADAAFGYKSGISRLIASEIKFQQLKSFFSKECLSLLRFPRPTRRDFLEMIQREAGVDVESHVRVTEDAIIVGKVQMPLPKRGKDGLLFGSLWEIVFYDFIKQHYPRYAFLAEVMCDPYEYGNVVMKKGDIVFDLGANQGSFSAVASQRGCRVFAFEAMPDTIELSLSKTAALNENINICNFAVWDKEETLEFSFMSNHSGSSRCDTLLEKKQRVSKYRKPVSVSAITLDYFVERNGLERVDFIKADIEGAERNMLRGATRVLREFAPKLALCTYHLPDDPQIMREIILTANPRYKIVERYKKMFAYVP